MLLDEPVSALDEAARWEALTLIERVTRRFAVPALYVSHQRSEVARVARHTARLHDGRIVASGQTSAVLAESSETGSVPNLFRAVYVEPGRAAIAGGATIELPQQGPIGGEVWCRLPSGAIALTAADLRAGLTARNRLNARVVAVDARGHRVRVAVDAGIALHADVTPETAEELRLRPGTPIACVFKVHSLEVLR